MTSNRLRRLVALVLLAASAAGGCGDAPTSKPEPAAQNGPKPPPKAPPKGGPPGAGKME